MAKTFGEMILECQNYEYSKENYELTKECYEIQLMSQYIESQEFMVENMADIREEYKEFDESYFGESVSNSELDIICESFTNKVKKLGKKIWNGLKEFWKKFCSFFKKLFGKSDKTTKKCSNIKEKLENLNIKDVAKVLGIIAGYNVVVKTGIMVAQDIEIEESSVIEGITDAMIDAAHGELFSNIWDKINKKLSYIPTQPFAKKIHIKGLNSSKYKSIINDLSIILSDEDIIVKYIDNSPIIGLDLFIHIGDKLIKCMKSDSNVSSKEINNIKKQIDNEVNYTNKHGCKINFNTSETKQKLQDIQDIVDTLSVVYFDYNRDGEYKELNDAYALMLQIGGNIMSAYDSIEKYRNYAGTKLSEAINKVARD